MGIYGQREDVPLQEQISGLRNRLEALEHERAVARLPRVESEAKELWAVVSQADWFAVRDEVKLLKARMDGVEMRLGMQTSGPASAEARP